MIMDTKNDKQTSERTERAADSALSAAAGSVFELVDCTSDEVYFPLGLFLTLEKAINEVKDCKEPPTDEEDYVKFEVRERQIGKFRRWDNGTTVATIEWIQDYIEAQDDWVWHKPTISLPNTEVSRGVRHERS